MYDATAPDTIPPNVPPPDYTMGYVDGDWPSYAAMAAKYPRAIPVALSAIPGSTTAPTAQGWDGEAGDYSPAQAAHFSAAKLVLGVVPFGYCSWAAWHEYQQAHVDIGVNPNEVDWGLAAYPGIGPVVYPGSVFHQFIDHGPYDESVVVDGWIPGRPVLSPTPSEVAMSVSRAVNFKNGQTDVFQVSFGTLWHKWLTAAGWHNEALTGPFGVVPPAKGLQLPAQEPQVSILGNQCTVTIEDAAGKVWYFAQAATSDGWGCNQLP